MLSAVFAKLQNPYLGQETVQENAWEDTLSEMTELEALIAVKDQLVQIDFANTKGLDTKLKQVLELDQSVYQACKKTTYNYLIKLHKDKSGQHDIYVVASEYHRRLYAAYTHVFTALESDQKIQLEAEQRKLFFARYLNAIFMMLKWRYFNHQPATPGVWASVHKIIKTAEELSLLNKSFLLYDFQVKETSMAAILERGYMVDTLHQGHFSAFEIELTDRVLKIWSGNPVVAYTYKDNRYQFFGALTRDTGPARLEAKQPLEEGCYWSTARMVELMENYLCAAEMGKSVAEFGLSGVASITKVVRLFKKLRVEWRVDVYSRQRRSEERSQKSRLLNIHYGLHAIHEYLVALQAQYSRKADDGQFTFELPTTMRHASQPSTQQLASVPETENWWMVDESSSGFAVDLGREVPEWAEIGMLVCYSEPGFQTTFNIAEIRSVRKLDSGAYRAGFKKVSQNTAAVNVSLEGVETLTGFQAAATEVLDDGLEKVEEFPGLLVDNDALGKPKLLLPLVQFVRGASYTISAGDNRHQVKTGKVLNKLNDWVLFEVSLNNK